MNRKRAAFTLLEIMIVVMIIGMLAAMGVQTFNSLRKQTRAKAVANDLRLFAGAFTTYALENGSFPPDEGPGSLPAVMDGWINPSTFEAKTPAGGNYDWDQAQFGTTAAVSVYNPTTSDDVFVKIDEVLDDGDLSGGAFRQRSGGFMYVIEE